MGTSRQGRLKRERDEDLRARIADGTTIGEIKALEGEVRDLSIGDREPSNGRIGAYRLLLDSKFRRLNKRLPDLKAVELTGESGGAVQFEVVIRPDGDQD